jgi:DNA-binding HxlR family transcriptional regulator
VLYERLRELSEAGLVDRDGDAWALTPLGAALGESLEPLDAWARRWARAQAR